MSSSQTKRAEQQRSRRVERKLAAQRAAKRRRILTFLSPVVAIALIVVLVLIVVNRPSSSSSPITVAGALASNLKPNGRAVGNPNAPVKIVEYGDYQCPGCENFYSQVEPQLFKDYVATGKVYFEFHDYPFLARGATPDESMQAAEAAYCAQDQGKFWEMHNTLYDNQKPENTGGFSISRLKEMGQKLGLNTSEFDSCLTSGKHQQAIEQMKTAGSQAGLQSTPSFVVNGTMINYTGYDSLKSAIAAATAGKK